MSEKLTPEVGDRVRLLHEDGDEVTITVKRVEDGGYLVAANVYGLHEGWSVVEILPKPLPPVGTFVKGVLKNGRKFVGLVWSTIAPAPFGLVDDTGVLEAKGVHEIESWEVLEA